MPEWKKVESPIKASTGFCEKRANPEPAEMDEPMQYKKSAAFNGGAMPKV